jgi:hypothetical protein
MFFYQTTYLVKLFSQVPDEVINQHLFSFSDSISNKEHYASILTTTFAFDAFFDTAFSTHCSFLVPHVLVLHFQSTHGIVQSA